MSKILDFTADIAFKWDSLKLKELVGLVGNLNVSSVAGLAGLSKLGQVVDNTIQSTSELATSLEDMRNTTGIDPMYMQELENLAFIFRGTKADADNLIKSLAKASNAAKMGDGSAITAFSLMGVNPYADLQTKVQQVRQFLTNPTNFNKLLGPLPKNSAERESILAFRNQTMGTLGITPEYIKFLTHATPEALAKTPHLSEEDLQDQADATIAWNQATVDLNTSLGEVVMKLERVGTSILNWVNNTKIIKTTFDDIGAVIEAFGIAGTNLQALGMNINTASQQGLLNAHRAGNSVGSFFNPTSAAIHKTTNLNINVHAQNADGVVDKINAGITHMLNLADKNNGSSS